MYLACLLCELLVFEFLIKPLFYGFFMRLFFSLLYFSFSTIAENLFFMNYFSCFLHYMFESYFF